MRERVIYTCEACRTDYADKEEAMRCELSHKKKLKIVDSRYLAHFQLGSDFPYAITVQSEDGARATYKR
nr:MAG TPA: hypothetical protein [Caudoviricetes sp.]